MCALIGCFGLLLRFVCVGCRTWLGVFLVGLHSYKEETRDGGLPMLTIVVWLVQVSTLL
jgi:hypothetical protein